MQYRRLGKTDIQVSVVGIGTWVTGGGPVWGADPEDGESIRAIQASLDAGVNLIDTAPGYGWGRSEAVVGQAIRGRRHQAVVATKCGLWWDDERGSFFAVLNGRSIRRALRPDTIEIEVERSLRWLGADYIDLYQTHWPSVPPDFTPIADTIACLTRLKDQGKIRAIGVSNVSLRELKENCAAGEIASDQFRYSLLSRGPEADILPFCQRERVAALTYMSLEQGLLTGKVGLDRVFAPDEFRSNMAWNPWFAPANRPRVLGLLAGWRPLTEKYDCTLAQLAIAWTAARPGVTSVLCGARRSQQALENAAAGEIVLAPEDLQTMCQDVESLGQPSPGE